jgi:prevent-host-death family protein
MIVTATEFKTNLGRYLSAADTEDILITKNGRSIAKLTAVKDEKTAAIHALRGVLKGVGGSLDAIRTERLAKYDQSLD